MKSLAYLAGVCKQWKAKRRLAADRAFRLSLLNRPHSIAARKGWQTRKAA